MNRIVIEPTPHSDTLNLRLETLLPNGDWKLLDRKIRSKQKVNEVLRRGLDPESIFN